MDKLMEAVFNHVIDDLLEAYCAQTAYADRIHQRDIIGRRLWEQLEGEQRGLLEEFQRACDCAQSAELEAMFLASFDAAGALHRPHVV